jgi:hypothetical protein
MQEFKGRVSGFSVKTVDTTGAGDAFVGALLVSMAKDTDAIFHVRIYSFYFIYFFLFHEFFFFFLELINLLFFVFRMRQNLERL